MQLKFTLTKRTAILCAAGLIGFSQFLTSCQKGEDMPGGNETSTSNLVYTDVEYTSMTGYLSAARLDMGVTTVGKKTYFIGGFNFSNNLQPRPFQTIDVFDGGNLGWTTEAFPAGHDEGFFKVAGSKIFFTGPKGFSDNNPTKQLEAYDLLAKSSTVYELAKAHFVKYAEVWEHRGVFAGDNDVDVIDLGTKARVSTMLPNSAKATDMAIWKGKAYFTVENDSKVYVYDLGANSWSNLSPGSSFNLVDATDDKLILSNTSTSTFYVYDLKDNSQKKFTLSTNRIQPNIVVAGNKVLFAGGVIVANGTGSSTEVIDIFDTRTSAITTKNMSEKRLGLAGAVNGNFVLLAGGYELGTKSPLPVFKTVDFFYLKK